MVESRGRVFSVNKFDPRLEPGSAHLFRSAGRPLPRVRGEPAALRSPQFEHPRMRRQKALKVKDVFEPSDMEQIRSIEVVRSGFERAADRYAAARDLE